jgi:CheY-like chemotaxis protein
MGVRIVLADDNDTVHQLIKTLLETRSEWQVLGEAKDGREAIEKASELNPDVVILDFRMPGMNGIDAKRAIVRKLPGMGVVVLTVHDSKTPVPLGPPRGGAQLPAQVGSRPAPSGGRRVFDYSTCPDIDSISGKRRNEGSGYPCPQEESERLVVQVQAALASTVFMKSRIMWTTASSPSAVLIMVW